MHTNRKRLKTPTKTTLLTKEEEYNLAKKIQLGDQEARDKFIAANYGLAVSIAKKYYRQDRNFTDLVQESYVGLLKAVSRFDPDRGNKFSTYATHWIRQAVLNYLNEGATDIKVPTHSRLLNSKIKKEIQDLSRELNRDPTLKEISDALDVPVKKIKYTLKANNHIVQLDSPYKNKESDETIKNSVEDDSPYINPEKNYLSKELDTLIRQSLALLTPKEEKIIRLRFGITESPDDIENFPVTNEMLSYLNEEEQIEMDNILRFE